jgi:hypothetical protein
MEGNPTSLLEGAITPVGPKDSDVNLLYGTQHDWPTYDLTVEKLTGVVRQVSFHGKPPSMKLESWTRETLTVVLAPLTNGFPRRHGRNDEGGASATVEVHPSKQIKDEMRAITLTVGRTTAELR